MSNSQLSIAPSPVLGSAPSSSPRAVRPRRFVWRAYECCVVATAVFLAVLAVWNLVFAAGLSEHRRLANDRLQLQSVIEQWCQSLTAQERALDAECLSLYTASIPAARPIVADLGLDRVRSMLKESNELLAATSRGLVTAPKIADDPDRERIARLRDQADMLREQYAQLSGKMTPEHPELQALRQDIADADQAFRKASNGASGDSTEKEPSMESGDPNIRVVANQYFRPAALTKKPTPPPAEPNRDLLQNLGDLEQRFQELRTATERLLTEVERERIAIPDRSPAIDAAWQAVTLRLAALEDECRLPPAIQKIPTLSEEPRTLAPAGLWSSLLCGCVAGLGMLCVPATRSTRVSERSISKKQSRPAKHAASETPTELSVEEIARTLGCAPLAVLRFDAPHVLSTAPHAIAAHKTAERVAATKIPETRNAAVGLSAPPARGSRLWIRRTAELGLAIAFAAVLLTAIGSAEFRKDLAARPTIAWGNHWAEAATPQSSPNR